MYWPIFVYLTQKSKEYIIKEDHMMLIYQFSINIGTFLISKILYIWQETLPVENATNV